MTVKQLDAKITKVQNVIKKERKAGREYSKKMSDAYHDLDLLNELINRLEKIEQEMKLLKL